MPIYIISKLTGAKNCVAIRERGRLRLRDRRVGAVCDAEAVECYEDASNRVNLIAMYYYFLSLLLPYLIPLTFNFPSLQRKVESSGYPLKD